MQLEIRDAIERDRVVYNALGLLAGCLIALLFFRRLSFMLIAAAPPLISILLALGAFGWLGLHLNIFLNMMTPLIMVISFSDSMQLTFDMRARLIAGASKREAIREALLVVGPACVMTHTAAAISFVALQVSESDLIRSFGQAGLLATAIALVPASTPRSALRSWSRWASATSTCSRATALPTRCRATSRRSRPAISSTESSPAPTQSTS
jgi:predicted RND superfamily exporter protein